MLRTPPEPAGIQVNFCDNPHCENYRAPAAQTAGGGAQRERQQQPPGLAQLQREGGDDDAVVGFADGDALFAHFAIDVGGPNEPSLGHRQHDQWAQITLNAGVGAVVRNALKYLGQDAAA